MRTFRRSGFVAVTLTLTSLLGCEAPRTGEPPDLQASVQALHLQGDQTLEGRIETKVVDDFVRGTATTSHTLITADGTRYRLELGGRSIPGRPRQTLRVHGTVSGDTLAVAAEATAIQVVNDGVGAAAVPHGEKKLALLLVRFTDGPNPPPHTVDEMRGMAFTNANSVNNYYREVSRGTVSLTGHQRPDGDVFGWFTVPNQGDCGLAWQAADAQAQQQDIDLTPYDHIMYIMPGMPCNSHAFGNRTVITWVTEFILAHELGHNFGIAHSNGGSCKEAGSLLVPLSTSCDIIGYADMFDIMGLGYHHTNAFHKWTLDYLAPSNVSTWSADGDFTLAPLGQNTTARQALRIARPSDGTSFYLQVRRPMGLFENFDAADPVVNGVSIHIGASQPSYNDMTLLDMRPGTPGPLDNPPVDEFKDSSLAVGQAFFDEIDRHTIQVLSVNASGATVRVLGNRNPIKINFQPASSSPAPGYLIDGGAVFGSRGNGQSYGWDVDNAVNARDRNSTLTPGGEQRYDTLNHLQKTPGARTWELAVPNGPYWVRIAAGDTGTASVFHTTVEGVTIMNVAQATGQQWFQRSGVVNVADGRLTVTNGASAVNNKICFIEVVSLTASGDTTNPTVSISAPAADATVSGTAVTVSAAASDNVGVAGLQFKLDGANLGSEDISAPYSTSWNTTLVPSGVHKLTAVARDAAGNTATSAAVTVVVSNSSGAFAQSSASDGIVSIEAEHYASKISRASKNWTFASETAASAGGAMACLPDTGGNINTGYATTSPQLNFRVNFVKTGTHQVWVRLRAPNDAADSLHVGIDGTAPASADRITGFNTSYGWSKITMDAVVATINVTSTGLHTINVWMREDGAVLDKLVLTTNTSLAVSGNGPAESSWTP